MIMGSRGVQGLPQEVFHMVLNCLENNKSSLRSCSLVCRSWLQASRPLLFATVSLYACEWRLVDFLGFLDTHSDITDYVLSLMLHKPMDEIVEGASDASVTPNTLARTARRLSRLRECQLYFVHIVPPSPPPPPPPEVSAVTDDLDEPPIDLAVFHIFGSSGQKIAPFIELLAHFRIGRLELELVTFEQYPAPPLPDVSRRIRVRELCADLETVDDAPFAILSALAPALAPGVLQAFHCSWREWNGCSAVGAFLRNAGHTIADLSLNMSVVSWVEDSGNAITRADWERLGLAACTAVRTFRTTMLLPTACPLADVADVRRGVASYRSLFALLPPGVRTVVISMSALSRAMGTRTTARSASGTVARGLIAVDFQEIEDALLALPDLEKVVIAMRAAQGAGAVAKAFPRLEERGVLEVRSGAALGGSFW
ncbi:hypothetical protein C8Q79DRAFT_226097 [Trametes meyenii]|nr:hypothetical protein C8Q79DRAFT_226097 [Trametes meyenii]